MHLGMFFKKNLEGGIIRQISQIGNDRALQFVFDCSNEIGDRQTVLLFIEMMGRNSNIIVTKEDMTIIDASRYLPPSPDNYRIVIPKAQYILPHQENTVNPFETDTDQILENFSGCSKMLVDEFRYVGSVRKVLHQEVKPTLIESGGKQYFHAFDLTHIEGERISFQTLSDLLDAVYGKEQKENTVEVSRLKNVIKRELSRARNKLGKLNADLSEAQHFSEYQKAGELLQANIYLIKKGDESITVSDFYEEGKETTIKLNPMIEPGRNLEHYFIRAKKAKKAVTEIGRQMELTNDEISYLETIDWQIDEATSGDIKEIEDELIAGNYLPHAKSKKTRPSKIRIETYQLGDSLIYVGKNNIQNDYLTNHFASDKDHFFHVKNAPGAHVIVRSAIFDERIIRTAAMVAANNSKLKLSGSIPVDYTLIKDVKKIPGRKGSNVIIRNQKTIYIDIDQKYLSTLKKV
jgi:predicted ribosome quality control (RQC) complex YloA/Tae2 family protein